PSRISAFSRERESRAMRAASTRSSRCPASSSATTTCSEPCIRSFMSTSLAEAAPEFDPAATRLVAKVRWLMIISGATTLLAIAAVLGVIGYRLFKAEGSAAAVVDATALLPRGARVISSAASGDRIVVTIENGGALEVHTFDVHTLKATGR